MRSWLLLFDGLGLSGGAWWLNGWLVGLAHAATLYDGNIKRREASIKKWKFKITSSIKLFDWPNCYNIVQKMHHILQNFSFQNCKSFLKNISQKRKKRDKAYFCVFFCHCCFLCLIVYLVLSLLQL